jgi:hypothetical protein
MNKKIVARVILLCYVLAAAVGLGFVFWHEPMIVGVFVGTALFVWSIANA